LNFELKSVGNHQKNKFYTTV